MKTTSPGAGRAETDLIDRIGSYLGPEVRADYYREMRHCRDLPENDEMLRILRAMQFLSLLIYEAPNRVTNERERLEKSFANCAEALTGVEARLAGLPGEVASGIAPEVIVDRINESLRQQFAQSTIPNTGSALAATAKQLRSAVMDFERAASAINDAHRSAAARADYTLRELRSSVGEAAKSARAAIEDLTTTFRREYRLSLCAACVLFFGLGVALGKFWL